jgi:squalene synthase HpnC
MDSALRYLRGRGAMWKGRVQAERNAVQEQGSELSSGKTQRDENFPVASLLIARRHRVIILAFYDFVREADDIADHPEAAPSEKLRLLDQMRRTLVGDTDAVTSGVKLRRLLAERRITPQHALDLLEAFRRDVTKLRYDDWNDLIDYCSVSAMPVGRFVLDVHGESRSLWPLNDMLCAALQIINHLQDCGADYRNLNRVYIPLDVFAATGAAPEMLRMDSAAPELRAAIKRVAGQTQDMLERAALFASSIHDRRLSLEVGVIHRLARDLNDRLLHRDPLCQRVHHSKAEAAALGAPAILRQLFASRCSAKPAIVAEGR